MDNKDLLLEGIVEDDLKKLDHSQPPIPGQLRREIDSLDDFEHLGHDSSPLQNKTVGEELFGSPSTRDTGLGGAINKGVETGAVTAANKIIGDELSSFDPLQTTTTTTSASNLVDKNNQKMDSNLFEMGDSLPNVKQPIDDSNNKLDKFLDDLSSFAPSSKHEEPPEIPNKDLVAAMMEEDTFKSATQNFMDSERDTDELIQPNKKTNELHFSNEQLERYSDVSDEPEEIEDSPKKQALPATPATNNSDFKDLDDFEPELPKKDYPAPQPATTTKPEVIKPKTPEPEPFIAVCPRKPSSDAKKPAVIDAEAIFCKMGLDTWFNPERLNPKVESLIYWRDPKKSGPVFGGVLLVLLSLTYFSLISVVAYLSLLGLTGTISFRIYKNIVQAVQKTGDGHPFKELLEFDVSLPQDKVKEVSEVAVAHLNAGVIELRRLFLVEDLVDSIKFGVLLWTLTYLGAWFNGMTLIIIAWVALFSLPKVYETNKTQIDANLEIVRTKLADITSKVKAAIPIGKKVEVEKKEQ